MKNDSKRNFILWLKKVDGQIKELINWIDLEKPPMDIIPLAKAIKQSYNGFYRMFIVSHLYEAIQVLENLEKDERKKAMKYLQKILENFE